MANSVTAIQVVDQSPAALVEYNLDEFPTDTYNRLIPTQTIAMPTDLFRPIVQVVQLSTNPDDGDVYHSDDMPRGNVAPTRVGLRKLATAAGISIIDERRTDDGSDPDVCEVTVFADMVLPTGQRLRAPGTKRIDMATQKWASDAHRAKFRSFFQEHVASRAQNRAVRALLSIRGSYPEREIAKPFAVVSYGPNMNHPEVRARILDAMVPVAAQLYGPSASVPQLAAGAPVVEVPPTRSLDDEPPSLGEAKPAADELSWLDEPAKAKPTFADAIRASAEEEGAPKGDMTAPQREALQKVFAGFGAHLVRSGLVALWGEAGTKPTAAQARALELAYNADQDGFRARWEALAEGTTR